MTNFNIEFEHPWLLLLLIPAIAFSVIPYFRSPKKYRRTRNRIVSIVLHATALVLSILVLSGILFTYDVPNKENEVILLVDKSDSNTKSNELKDQFVLDVLSSVDAKFKVGVVTFGYDQVYAAEISDDGNQVYNDYLRASKPDGTATDFEAALTYAASLFEKPESARIVVLSDGVETDGEAKNVIKAISAQGIKVDTVRFPDETDDEVQIISVDYQDASIRHGQDFTLSVNVESSYEGEAVISMFDDATQIGEAVKVRLVKGVQSVEMEAMLALPGLHKLTFEIESVDDTLSENNVYNSYLYIDIFDKLLVIESITGESDSLKEMMPDKKITVVNVADSSNMPTTLDQLREYDEIVLVNVSNADMPEGFDQILYQYVKDIGGGLFTICGNKEDSNPYDDVFEANAFTRDDMYGSLYQELLPVEVIEYTPPVAVIIIIDTSGSMYDPDGGVPFNRSKLYAAQQGAEACLDALTERDWVGIMTFSDEYQEDLELTPRVERDKILAAIDALPKGGGGTVFTGALERAGSALAALSGVEKRHIILVTDGEPGDPEEEYGAAMKRNADLGITMSIVGIESAASESTMRNALEKYAGVSPDNFHNVEDISAVPTVMRDDLEVPEIKDVNYEEFTPTIKTYNSVVEGLKQSEMPKLEGFYGTRAKNGAEVILMGDYVPIYAQWKVGKGTVGSFLCDLNGTWSSDFISSEAGKLLVNNMVEALFPTENIQVPDIRLSMKEKNYTTELNIFADAQEGDMVEVNIIPRFHDGEIKTLYPEASEAFGKISFEITEPDVYEVQVLKKAADGTVLASHSVYKAFSYSQEYNLFYEEQAAADFLTDMADSGDGFALTNANQVLENVLKYLHKVIDPRIVLIIIALVAFVLDIAVRKFKFKWPHELIRESKARKAEKK